MLDEPFRARVAPLIRPIARRLAQAGVTANHVTVASFACALVAAAAIASGRPYSGLALWIASRVGDGLDGAVAREGGSGSPFGGYLDITLDMAAYAIMVIAFAAVHPSLMYGWLAVLTGYIVVITTTLALSDSARAASLTVSTTNRTFQFTAGLTEAGETSVMYALWTIFPHHVSWLVWVWVVALAVTCGQRTVTAVPGPPKTLKEKGRAGMSRNPDRPARAAGIRVLALGCFFVLAAALSTASVPSVPSVPSVSSASSVDQFDHGYADYAGVLTQFVRPPLVDYARLLAGRAALDRVVAGLNTEAARGEPSWPRQERLAFWINAYNVLTLQAIVNHYPIRGGWFSRGPSPSIRQIPGVWTSLKWPVAGRSVTLDDIEHRILRPEFAEPRIHFAINCASIGCPPLAAMPYVAATLSDALDASARTYLASPQGVKVASRTLGVTSIFDWYGDDFVAQYAPRMPGDRPPKLRAILAVVSAFGPPAAAELARAPDVSLRFLDYDWRLNDTGLASGARTSPPER